MSTHHAHAARLRVRWSAVGAAVAITLGAGGVGIASATVSDGPRAVYTDINPCRLEDTRPDSQIGERAGTLGADGTQTHSVFGSNGECTAIPSDVVAIVTNVTGVSATQGTFLTLFPADEALPTASHLNMTPGQPPLPNAVTVGLDATGKFKIFNKFGNVHYIVDIVGYYQGHTHDDRYYTKAQVDALPAARSFTVVGTPTQEGPFDGKTITTSTDVIGSVTVTAPVGGTVTLITNGGLQANASDIEVTCAINTGSAFTGNDALSWTSPNAFDYSVLSITRVRTVTAGSTTTFNSFCKTSSSTANVRDRSISAIFTPAP